MINLQGGFPFQCDSQVPKEAPPVTTVVGTQTIDLEAEATSGWADYTFDLDTVAILNAIGIKPDSS